MFRRLLTPRWIAGHLVVLTVVGVFLSLGTWQLRRLDDQRKQIAVIQSRTRQPLADLSDLPSASLSPETARRMVYRRAAVGGVFDVEQEVLLEGRSHLGRPGRHVLTPLKISDDSAVLVDRGWVPMMLEDPPVAEAAPPAGEVALRGVLLLPPSKAGFGPDDPPPGRVRQIPRVDLQRLDEQVPYHLLPLYLHLEEQQPPNKGVLPTVSPVQKPEEGPHLSYAIQWFSFGAFAAITYVAFLRRQAATGTAA